MDSKEKTKANRILLTKGIILLVIAIVWSFNPNIDEIIRLFGLFPMWLFSYWWMSKSGWFRNVKEKKSI